MPLNSAKHIIVVMSGKGGVGKSTVAVHLSESLSRKGFCTGLMDIDLHGPSVPAMIGIGQTPMSISADNKMIPVKKNENLHIVSIASLLESPDDPIIWRGPMKMGVIEQFINDVAWPDLDYLVVDCPPGTGDEVLSIIQLLKKVSGAIIVSTPQKIAYLDVRKSIQFANKLDVPLLGLVENMTAIQCPHCHQPIFLSDASESNRASKDFNIDILGHIPWDDYFVQAGDKGINKTNNVENSPGYKEMENIVEIVIKKIPIDKPLNQSCDSTQCLKNCGKLDMI